jgi:hypothetical protein
MSELIPTRPEAEPAYRADEAAVKPISTAEPPAQSAVWTPRIVAAMLVALAADTVGAPFGELGVVVFDLVVGVILTAILGPSVALVGALVVEAIPAFGMFPSWIAAVVWVAYSRGGRKP